MTELTGTTVANTRTVEGFLNALQDADYDAAVGRDA
ncbi:limonene-1,2-epoxide hydrolase family protein, partial [Mycobacterium avium]